MARAWFVPLGQKVPGRDPIGGLKLTIVGLGV